MNEDENARSTPTPYETNMGLPTAPSNPSAPNSESAPIPQVSSPENPEKWLWIDPLAARSDDRIKAGAVLLDDVIKDYVNNYGLLFDKSEFVEGKLKGASYTMTPAKDSGWRFFPGQKPGEPDTKVPLQTGRDNLGEFYWVPRNSLVFIKLKQRLRLPFYLIGRHNLKIRYVYKGLLLGTGPQVDPGFEGNLFIPLHNFTTADVKVHVNESFVSIDFVRTTRFIEEGTVAAQTLKELRLELKGKRALIEEFKVTGRQDLEDYLDGSTPRSQMAEFESKFDGIAKEVKKDLDKAKTWIAVERIAVAIVVAGTLLTVGALLVASLNYFRGFVADIKSETRELKSTRAANSASFESRVAALETNRSPSMDDRLTLKTSFFSSSAVLASNIAQLQTQLANIQTQFVLYQRSATNAGTAK